MVTSRSCFLLAAVAAALWAASSLAAWPQSPQKSVKPAPAQGRQTFASTCAGCHGLDGRGSERAPNIVENPKVQRFPDAQIARIIENGVPGTGMPPFHSLTSSDVQAVVAYLRSLQGTKHTLNLPGDADRGEKLFYGQTGFSGCHMTAGKGGFIASDLSSYARTHSVEQIRSAITTQTPGNGRQARLVTVTTRAGEKYVGRIRNEDNFSLQLQTLDGTFYFVDKADLTSLDSSQTLMPSTYGSTLNTSELNDLISYLMRVADVKAGAAVARKESFEDP